MSQYQFELTIQMAPSECLYSPESVISIPCVLSEHDSHLRILDHANNPRARRLVLHAHNFESPDDAVEFGREARSRLKIAFALVSMGIEISLDEQVYPCANSSDGYVDPDHLDGLVVYPEGVKLSRAHVEVTPGLTGPNLDRLHSALRTAFELASVPDDIMATVDLYMTVPFQSTMRGRFLQLMTVVESVGKPRRLEDPIPEIYRRCRVIAEETLPAALRCDWLSRLGHLQNESISSACVRVVKEMLGDEDATRLHELYSLRSSVVHARTAAPPDLRQAQSDLSSICLRLIHKLVLNSWGHRSRSDQQAT